MASTGSSSSVVTTETAAAQADLVVGLVSHNNAATAETVAGAVRGGLARDIAGVSSRIVLADCGSTDDTPARLRRALDGTVEVIDAPLAPTTAELLERPYHRIPGKARALQAIMTSAKNLSARACVVLDASIESVTPQWLEWLAGPVLTQEFDLIAPCYRRHPYEGALTKGLVYPVFRALYGVRLRQPAAGEFVCSGRLLDHFLDDEIWDRDGAQVGIDLWLATSAVSDNYRIGEATVGVRRYRMQTDETPELATTLAQVVGSLFADLEARPERWQRVRGSAPVPQFGEPARGPVDTVAVDHETLIESFRLGYRELRDIWTWVLPPRSIIDLRRLTDISPAKFHLDDQLWARIVYDFALGYRLRVLARDHLLRSLVPLYLAWLASFVVEVRDRSDDDIEARLERLASAFETQKPYLISKWRWPERLRS
jgi:hypothetical protein